MNILNKIRHVLPLLVFTLISIAVNSQNLDDFRYNGTFNPEKKRLPTHSSLTGIPTTGMISGITGSVMATFSRLLFRMQIILLPRARWILQMT